ncbi:hypothetical protein DSECCO2_580970 [anaerobic digester metagenome]
MDCKRRRQGIEDYTGPQRNRDDAGAANAREKNCTAAVLYAALLSPPTPSRSSSRSPGS